MENNYFQPDITDIFVGYEYEAPVLDYSCHDCEPQNWNKEVFGTDIDLDLRTGQLPKLPHPQLIRVKFLDKEQFFAERWRNFTLHNRGYILTKGFNGNSWWKLYYDETDVWLHIERIVIKQTGAEIKTRYEGPCRDINQFRQISKLLNIPDGE